MDRTVAALARLCPALEALREAHQRVGAAVDEASWTLAALQTLLDPDGAQRALVARMVAAGWDEDAADDYVGEVPVEVCWLYPVAVPRETGD